MSKPESSVFIFGLGYTGQVIAKNLSAQGYRVAGSTRSPEKALELSKTLSGCTVHRIPEGDTSALVDVLQGFDTLVYTAGATGSHDQDETAQKLQQRLGNLSRRSLTHVVYLSSTGVYAETDGGTVTEESPLATHPRALRRLHAEDVLNRAGDLFTAFRLAAIYGPSRGLAIRLQAGTVRLWGGGDNVINRIHVQDIARFVTTAIQKRIAGTYNLADDHPCPLREHATWLCEQMGLELPPTAPLSDAPSPTLLSNKRVHNGLAKKTFGHDLLAPTYREGHTLGL